MSSRNHSVMCLYRSDTKIQIAVLSKFIIFLAQRLHSSNESKANHITTLVIMSINVGQTVNMATKSTQLQIVTRQSAVYHL